MRQVIKCWVETGLPYIAFKDTINRYNPNKDSGIIPNGNLCMESFSNFEAGKYTHVCNLLSLNLANIENVELEKYVKTGVLILDNLLEVTNPPTETTINHNNDYRTIGLGVMGLADWLAKNEISYTSEKTHKEVSKLFEKIAYYSIEKSCELGEERGSFPLFQQSEWAKGNLLGRPLSWFLENCKAFTRDHWLCLSQMVKECGMRNSQLLAIAPNTSTSLLQGCTASILPPYQHFFYDSNSKGTTVILPQFIKTHKSYYTENKDYPQESLVTLVGKCMQPFVDSGISMELLFNFENLEYRKASYIFKTFKKAWLSGCKTIYYVRTIEPDLTNEPNCDCSN